MKKFYILLSLVFTSSIGLTQNGVNKEKYRISIKRAVDKITIDGKLDERSWKEADQTSPFNNKWPTDKGLPPLQTNVKLTYDDKFIYIGAVCKEENSDQKRQRIRNRHEF